LILTIRSPSVGKGGYGALFAVMIQNLMSITRVAVQVWSEPRIYPLLQSFGRALAQSCPGERSESGVAVQTVSEPENCHGAGFKLCADARVRV
jgi:hypothetical protein